MAGQTKRDAELLALIREADRLKVLRINHQGRLVSMTKANELHVEVLAGALLCAVEADDVTKEGWR
ncbi:MAG: hypothetical protein PGN23_06595 [Sphingomonas adhaesiva]|uniref:hypothetical protein n=1 Tax=Sphingomonas TaxID=13687 RepID=UPI002FF72BB8